MSIFRKKHGIIVSSLASVFAVVLAAIMVFSSVAEEKVSAATAMSSAYNAKGNFVNPYFSKNGTNLSKFSQMENGQTMYVMISFFGTGSMNHNLLYAPSSGKVQAASFYRDDDDATTFSIDNKKAVWLLKREDDGYFSFKNAFTSQYLHGGTGTDDSANVKGNANLNNATKWTIEQVNSNTGSIVKLHSVSRPNASLNLDAGEGPAVFTYTTHGGSNETWMILPLLYAYNNDNTDHVAAFGLGTTTYGRVSTTGASFYSSIAYKDGTNITNKLASGADGNYDSTFSEPKNQTAIGSSVETWGNQLYQFTCYTGNTAYMMWNIRTKVNGQIYFLDISNGSEADGTKVGFYKPESGTTARYHQRFYITYSMCASGGFNVRATRRERAAFMPYLNRNTDTGRLQIWTNGSPADENTFFFRGKVTAYVKDVVGTSTSDISQKLNGDSGTEITDYFNQVIYGSQRTATYDGYTYNECSSVYGYKDGLVVYRYFTAHTYTVVYNINSGTGGSTAKSSHTYGVNKALTANGFTRSYTVAFDENGGTTANSADTTYKWTFKNWNTKPDGSGTSYSDKKSVKNLTATNGGTFNLYAQWTKADPIDVTAKTSTRDGYKFYGWGAVANGITSKDDLVTSVDNITAKTTLYAYWIGIDDTLISGIRGDLSNAADDLQISVGVYNETKKQTGTFDNIGTVTYKWYRKTKNSETEVAGATSNTYDVTESDRGNVIKGVAFLDGTQLNYAYSALIPSTIKVNANAQASNKTSFSVSGSIAAGATGTFEFTTSEIISGVETNLSGITYKVYGYLGGRKALIMSSNDAKVFEQNVDISLEGIVFDKVSVEITASSAITVNDTNYFKIVSLPRVYQLVVNDANQNANNQSVIVGYEETQNSYTNTVRATDSQSNLYFYQGDSIKIDVPVAVGNKLTAGSHITVNGEKVFPTHSVSTNGYITFIYTNYYESLIDRTEDVTPVKIQIDETNPKDMTVGVYFDSTGDDKLHDLNFGPLGVKIHSEGKIRFGTVWYFDDNATGNSWSRGDGMGTYIIPFKNILANPDDKTNDFYNFVSEKYPDVITEWNEDIADNIVDDVDLQNTIMGYLAEFIKEWNDARTNNSDITETSIKQMSFGGKELVVGAEKYYYRADKDGNRFMEYSAVMGVGASFADRQLIYIPYVSYVAGWDNGFLAPNNDTYKDDIYLYKAPEKVYTYNEVVASQPSEGGVGEAIPEPAA